MMYRTCGTQLNIDYSSEKILLKFKVINSIVPSIVLFANSSIVEKKRVIIYLIDQKFAKYI